MMNKKFLLEIASFSLLSIFIASNALADKTVYFKGFYNGTNVDSNKINKLEGLRIGDREIHEVIVIDKGPYNQTKDKYDFGKAVGAAIGIKNGNFSFELEAVASGVINSQGLKDSRKTIFKEVEADTIKVVRFLLKNSDYKNEKASTDVQLSQSLINTLKNKINDRNNKENKKVLQEQMINLKVQIEIANLEKGITDPNHHQKMKAIYKNIEPKNFKYSATMVNAYYSLPVGQFDIYGGVGAGIAKVNTGNLSNKSKFSAALQGKIGSSFNLSQYFTPYVGYKMLYIAPTNYSVTASSNFEVKETDTTYETILEDTIKFGTSQNNEFLGKGDGNLNIRKSHLLHSLEVGVMIPFSF